MQFFTSSGSTSQTLIVALGARLAVWGVIFENALRG
ncbi:Maff2 family mobile element protein [Pectinatus cerevisiiphilus]|uniref:Maff2 family protein n=1 Tax=Pectinatus cerevisiiphilus TaxID=86956 RepID=A0A4R3K2E8_9FIRM|nr:Maff2 family protein [Pectinatus cerevisiiphilus]